MLLSRCHCGHLESEHEVDALGKWFCYSCDCTRLDIMRSSTRLSTRLSTYRGGSKMKYSGEKNKHVDMQEFAYFHGQAHPYTFRELKIRVFVEKWCNGRVLNLFAGQTRLNCDEFRVDLDEAVKPDFCGDAYDFLINHCHEKFDTVILDPPFNQRKSMEKYDGRYFSKWRKVIDALIPHLNEGATIISFGFNTSGMSHKRGFRKIAVMVCCHFGSQNDTLAVVEKRYTTLGGFT